MIKIKDLIHKYTVWESETEKSKKTVLDGAVAPKTATNPMAEIHALHGIAAIVL